MLKTFRIGKKDFTGYNYRLILDVGTEYLKAVMVEYGDEVNVVGYAKLKQRHGDMEGGSIADIDGVIATARRALGEICQKTPHRPGDVVIGIAGSFVKGIVTNVTDERRFPHKCINNREIMSLVNRARKRGQAEATKILTEETGLDNLKVCTINSAVTEVRVDGFRVATPLRFRANNLAITFFHTFCPLVHLGALNSLADGLKLPLAGTLAEPFAVASCMLNAETHEFGAIVIDIGGGTTDIGLIRNGGIEATEILAMGGRAFTRSLAAQLNISLAAAEELKIKYSLGSLEEETRQRIAPIIESNLQIVYQGLEAALTRLSKGEVLPRRIFFCGGGSALKGLMEGMAGEMLFNRLPYFENPQVSFLQGEDIKSLNGNIELLVGPGNVTPAALAKEGVKVGRGLSPLLIGQNL